jgi:hypothetical protein
MRPSGITGIVFLSGMIVAEVWAPFTPPYVAVIVANPLSPMLATSNISWMGTVATNKLPGEERLGTIDPAALLTAILVSVPLDVVVALIWIGFAVTELAGTEMIMLS